MYLASKEVSVTVNQRTYTTTTNQQGRFNIPITIYDTGILDVIVSYNGDIVYNPCNITAKLNSSSKMRVVFDDYDENNLTETVIVGDILILKGHVYDNFTQKLLDDVNVTLTMINYTYQTTSNQDGKFTLEIPTNGGNFNLYLLFEKEYYNSPKEVFKVYVNRMNLTLSIDTTPEDLKLGDNVTVTIKVMDEDVPVKNQTVYVTINDDVYGFVTDDAGIINFQVPTKMVGQNNITVVSKETSYYSKNNISTTFNVDYNTVNLEVTTDSNNTRIDNNVTIQITASDAYDNPIINHQITVNINENLSYNLTTDKEGKTNITITPDTNGQNNITAILKESNNYLEHTKNTTFNVRKINTTLTINNTPVSIEANQNANISILVYLFDEDGNPLNNNQKVNIQYGTDTISNGYTNEEGVYSFKLSRQYESSQIYINAYFDETTKHTASSNNISVTIEVPPTEEDNTTNPIDTSNNTSVSNSTSNDNTGYSNSSDNTNINPGNPTNNNKPNTPGKPTPPNTNPNNNENTPQTGNNQNTNNNKPTQPNIPGKPTQTSMNPNNNQNKTTPSTSNNPEHINDITNNTPNNMPDETEGNIIPEIPQNTNNTENSEDNENHNPMNPPYNPNNNQNTESQDTPNENEDLKEDVEVSDEPKSEDNPINEEIPKEEPDEENQPQNENQDEVKPETNENNDEQQIEDEINPQKEVSDNTQDPQDIESTDNPQETITPESYEEPTITSSESPLIDSSDNINVEDNTIAAVATTNKACEIIPNPIEDNISWTWLIVLIIAFGSILYGYLRFKETN